MVYIALTRIRSVVQHKTHAPIIHRSIHSKLALRLGYPYGYNDICMVDRSAQLCKDVIGSRAVMQLGDGWRPS